MEDLTEKVSTGSYEQLACSKEIYTPAKPFTSAKWTLDGTHIFTADQSHTFRLHPLQPALHPTQNYTFAEPCNTYSLLPRTWADESNQPIYFSLHAQKELPIQLLQFPASPDLPVQPLARYNWLSADGEKRHLPSAMTPSWDGQQFILGSKNLLAVFDVDRPDSGPVWEIGTVGFSKPGPLSALALGNTAGAAQIIAAGSMNGQVLLVDSSSSSIVTEFRLKGMQSDRTDAHEKIDIGGNGVTDVLWSPCGSYLYIFERLSAGGVVFDIRGMAKVGVLTGRCAWTAMRMGVDVMSDGGGTLLAGGTDGVLREWTDVHRGGVVEPAFAVRVHGDYVNSVCADAQGSRVVTASGSRDSAAWDQTRDSSESDSDSSSDSSCIDVDYSIKAWKRETGQGQQGAVASDRAPESVDSTEQS